MLGTSSNLKVANAFNYHSTSSFGPTCYRGQRDASSSPPGRWMEWERPSRLCQQRLVRRSYCSCLVTYSQKHVLHLLRLLPFLICVRASCLFVFRCGVAVRVEVWNKAPLRTYDYTSRHERSKRPTVGRCLSPGDLAADFHRNAIRFTLGCISICRTRTRITLNVLNRSTNVTR